MASPIERMLEFHRNQTSPKLFARLVALDELDGSAVLRCALKPTQFDFASVARAVKHWRPRLQNESGAVIGYIADVSVDDERRTVDLDVQVEDSNAARKMAAGCLVGAEIPLRLGKELRDGSRTAEPAGPPRLTDIRPSTLWKHFRVRTADGVLRKRAFITRPTISLAEAQLAQALGADPTLVLIKLAQSKPQAYGAGTLSKLTESAPPVLDAATEAIKDIHLRGRR